VPFQPRHHFLVLVGAVVVDDQVQLLVLRRLAVDLLGEAQPFLVGVALFETGDDPSGRVVHAGERVELAMAAVVVGPGADMPDPQRQVALRTLQRLALRLLVAAHHHGILPRG